MLLSKCGQKKTTFKEKCFQVKVEMFVFVLLTVFFFFSTGGLEKPTNAACSSSHLTLLCCSLQTERKASSCMTSAEGNEITCFSLMPFSYWHDSSIVRAALPDCPGNNCAVSSDRTAGGGATRWEVCLVTGETKRHGGFRYNYIWRTEGCLYVEYGN